MDLQRIIYLVKETKEIITNREMAAHVKEKGVADYVTQVDVAVQNFLKEELYKLYPEIQFLGEETGLQQMNTDSYWILDPVDGTTNLIHDYHHSVVSLALCQQNEIVLGIVYDPYMDSLKRGRYDFFLIICSELILNGSCGEEGSVFLPKSAARTRYFYWQKCDSIL